MSSRLTRRAAMALAGKLSDLSIPTSSSNDRSLSVSPLFFVSSPTVSSSSAYAEGDSSYCSSPVTTTPTSPMIANISPFYSGKMVITAEDDLEGEHSMACVGAAAGEQSNYGAHQMNEGEGATKEEYRDGKMYIKKAILIIDGSTQREWPEVVERRGLKLASGVGVVVREMGKPQQPFVEGAALRMKWINHRSVFVELQAIAVGIEYFFNNYTCDELHLISDSALALKILQTGYIKDEVESDIRRVLADRIWKKLEDISTRVTEIDRKFIPFADALSKAGRGKLSKGITGLELVTEETEPKNHTDYCKLKTYSGSYLNMLSKSGSGHELIGLFHKDQKYVVELENAKKEALFRRY